MMRRPRLTGALIAAFALLLCGAAATGCGGSATKNINADGTPGGTAQEYFERLAELNDQAAQGLETVNNDLATALPTDRGLAALRASITQYAAVYQAFRDGMQQISPPQELQVAHQEAIAALTAFIDYSEEAAAQAEAAQDIIDIIDIIENEETQTINDRLTAACTALQQAAASEGIDLELACGE